MKEDKLSRRSVIKAGAVAGATTLAAPAMVSEAFASSGEMNLMDWSDYWPDEMLKGFTDSTGIKVNYTGYGSNEELINKMKASQGSGADLIGPTNNRNLQWAPLGLLQPFDMSRVPIANANPAMAAIGPKGWDFDGKGNTWIPHIWGTEGMAWRTDEWTPEASDGVPSYGAVWEDRNAGKTMCRAHSGMLGAGLYLERIGQQKPGSIWDAYKDEATFRAVWGPLTDWCIAHKKNIKLIWNDCDTQKNGLMNNGVVVGQTWDGPPLALKTAGDPVTYQAPGRRRDGLGRRSRDAQGRQEHRPGLRVDQIRLRRRANAGKAINFHGYNSPIIGADKYASAQYAKNFAEAYPGDALAKLNPWPAEPPWYANVRTEYVNKFISA